MKHIKDGLFYAILGLICICIGIGAVVIIGDAGWPIPFAFILGGICLFASFVCFMSKQMEKEEQKYQTTKEKVAIQKQQEELQKQQEELQKRQESIRLEKERIDKINSEMKEGLWKFPSAKFYQLCRDGHATVLDNEFSVCKATHIAQQLILERDSKIDLKCCEKYLSIDGLNRFLEEGKHITAIAESEALLLQKKPKDAENLTKQEQTFLARAKELNTLHGNNKRLKMLENLYKDYGVRIQALADGEKAMKQLGMIYLGQQQKESSWAVLGGIAEGIAGPAAGIMAASNAMKSNTKIQEHNAAVRKASMDIMSGIPGLSADRYTLEKEQESIKQQYIATKNEVTLATPSAKEIRQNITIGKTTVKKNPSGALSVSVSIALKEPFSLNVPRNVLMVVDGTLKGIVWHEDEIIGEVLFPLPIGGIPCYWVEEITLDGLCGRSMDYDGKYTVKILSEQNLWVMECQCIKHCPPQIKNKQEASAVILREMERGIGYYLTDLIALPVLSCFTTSEIRPLLTPLIMAGKIERTEDEQGKPQFWKI